MSTRIKILTEQLANKIAAGEVVERPASVVKELVENALDAGGTDIIVEIEDGGKRLIRVSDNGFGMSREDALLSMERHATSKISSDHDLFHLQSLGFRGEALASIASVSRFTLSTRERENIEGTEIYAEGGKIRDVKSCGMPEGTVMAVRNLFFNTPARLKFMKSRETETGHIGEFLNRLAISRPDVRFNYTVDGRTVMKLLPGDLTDRIAQVLGGELVKDLYPIDREDSGVQLKGLLGSPAMSRSSATHLYTFINGRFIRDKVVQHALLQSYRNVLERGRYPILILFINLPAEDVDVNVHPTKHEVRFREQTKVHAAIQNGVDELLRSVPWLRKSTTLFQDIPEPTQHPSGANRVEEVKESLLKYALKQEPLSAQRQYVPAAGQEREPDVSPVPEHLPQAVTAESENESAYFSDLQVIGQFRGNYLLCQESENLVIIDQHAAHERVVFEELRASMEQGSLEGQNLLFPETLEFSPAEASALKENNGELERLAFELEHFGGNTWLLKSVPLLLSGQDYKRTLRDILEEIVSIGRSRRFAEIVDDILATIACHSVVRGEWRLSLQEIRRLLERMDGTGFAANCPHGRPVVAKVGLREIEKMFKRV